MKQSEYEYQKQYWGCVDKRRPPWHPAVEAFAGPKTEYIRRYISEHGLNDGLSALDIGCGNGFFTYRLETLFETTALDFSRAMLRNNSCRRKVCGSATELPFKSRSFDVGFCSNLLHHLPDPVLAVSEMKRISRRYVVLSEPNRGNPLMFLFGLLKKAERGTLKFSLSYLRHLAEKAGLRVIASSRMGIVLPNKTPLWLLPLLTRYDGEFPLAFYSVVVAEIR